MDTACRSRMLNGHTRRTNFQSMEVMLAADLLIEKEHVASITIRLMPQEDQQQFVLLC